MDAQEIARELDEIRYEMEELVHQAQRLVGSANRGLERQSKGYWYAHIIGALNRETQFVGGGSMVTMEDTIESLRDLKPRRAGP